MSLHRKNRCERKDSITDTHIMPRSLQIQSQKSQKTPNENAGMRSGEGTSGAAIRGSVTVEAALALSFFLLFFTVILSAFPVLRQEIETLYELDTTCEKAAMAAAFLEDRDSSYDGNIVLALTDSEKLTFPGKRVTLKTGVSVCRRAWTGRVLTEDESDQDGEDGETYVYVCVNGTVYHVSEDCSYLHITVKSVAYSRVSSLRNKSGEKYKACERCGEICGKTVYVTEGGNRFHSDPECGGLKRTYSVYLKREVDLPACSKCGGG